MLLYNWPEIYMVTLLGNRFYGGKWRFRVTGSDELLRLIEEFIGVGCCDFKVERISRG